MRATPSVVARGGRALKFDGETCAATLKAHAGKLGGLDGIRTRYNELRELVEAVGGWEGIGAGLAFLDQAKTRQDQLLAELAKLESLEK